MLLRAFSGAFLIAVGIISLAVAVSMISISSTSAGTSIYLKARKIAQQKVYFSQLTKQSERPTPLSSPSPTTVPWNTYRNEDFSFAMEYPDGWQYRELGNMVSFYKAGKIFYYQGAEIDPIYVSVLDIVDSQNAQYMAQKQHEAVSPFDFMITVRTAEYEGFEVNDSLRTYTYIDHAGKVYILSMANAGNDLSDESVRSVLRDVYEMFSTFRFINI